MESCPDPLVPEVALIGRSNVGKSSLVNLLTNHTHLAKVSGTPGHTKLINFFVINKGEWRLVDLPGYGFARTGEAERTRFIDSVADYVMKRPGLGCVYVLIDCRHEPQEIDLSFLDWVMKLGRRVAVIFTKADKVKPSELARNMETFMAALEAKGLPRPPAFSCSAKARAGQVDILNHIGTLV